MISLNQSYKAVILTLVPLIKWKLLCTSIKKGQLNAQESVVAPENVKSAKIIKNKLIVRSVLSITGIKKLTYRHLHRL